MNWLAHLLLSQPNLDCQMGNILADLKKASVWLGTSKAFRKGEELHLMIDQFTDSHPVFKNSVARLRPAGRLRGIIIDVVYDHMLAINWSRYCEIPYRDFIDAFNLELSNRNTSFPQKAEQFLDSIFQDDRLGKYDNLLTVKNTFTKIDRRLSKRVISQETCISYYPKLIENFSSLEADFLVFFPEIKSEIEQYY